MVADMYRGLISNVFQYITFIPLQLSENVWENNHLDFLHETKGSSLSAIDFLKKFHQYFTVILDLAIF